jgi:tetratricopeptide (TPR) repeat protein
VRVPPSSGPAKAGRYVPLIFLTALAVRLVHVWQIRGAPFFTVLMGDSAGYDAWAQRIAGGDWVGQDVFYQAPLYPYVLGTIYWVIGRDLLLVRVAQAVIGALSCVLLALAASRLFASRRAGAIAGLGLALYAPAIFFDALVQKAVLDVFFVCLALWILSGIVDESHSPCHPRRAERAKQTLPTSQGLGAIGHQGRALGWFWLGLVMGALSLTRENALVLAGVMLAWAIVRRMDGSAERTRLAAAGAFTLGLALVIAPVAIRNSLVGGGVFLTTAQFGPNFYIGNNPRADGSYASLRFGRGAPEFERQDAKALAEEAERRRLTDAEVSGYWTGQALDFIRSDPRAWLRLLGRKAALLVNRTEMLDTESQETHEEWSTPLRVAARVGHFGVLVPLAVLGVIVTWPRRRQLLVVYALVLAYAASVVMFYVFARYRYPLVPFLMLFAAAGVAGLPQFRAAARPARMWAVAAAVVIGAVFVNQPMLSADLMRAITAHNIGAALQEAGRLDEAIAEYRRAIAIDPDYAPAFNNLGVALAATDRFDEAVGAFRDALRLDPDSPVTQRNLGDAHYNLGSARFEAGNAAEAVDHFRAALRLMPDSADVHNNLGVALASEGHVTEAVDHFNAALKLRPEFSDAQRNLAAVRQLTPAR